jgi:hypothetical protein
MLESGGRASRWITMLAAGTLALGLLPGTASAAGSFSVNLEIWGRCVSGGPIASGQKVTVRQKRNIPYIATRTVTAKNNRFTACVKQIQPADALIITSGAKRRAFNVPYMDAFLDPATDMASGSMPVGTATATIDIAKMVDGFQVADHPRTLTLAGGDIDEDGSWEQNVSGDLDVLGGDRLKVTVVSARGDVFTLNTSTPAAWVQVGRSTAGGSGTPGERATVLDKAGATLKAKGSILVPQDRPWFTVPLKLAGVAVPVAIGDTITLSQLVGPSLVTIANTMVVDPASGGSLTATCWEGGRYAVLVGAAVKAQGVAGAGGAISEGNLNGAGTLPSGTKVMLACETPDALGQVFVRMVP